MAVSTRGKYRSAVWPLLASMLFLLPVLSVAQNNNTKEENPEVTRLLADAREKAAVLSKDADEMEALTRSDVSWQSHAAMADTMRGDVNELASSVEKLKAARDSASPWQRQAVDRMIPLMKDLAANTTAAINHLNQQRTRPLVGSPYVEYVKQNAETAHDLSNMISSLVQFGQTRAKLEKMEQRLEVDSRASK
jgi:hypothetical protein